MKIKISFLALLISIVSFAQKSQISLPINWNDTANVDYTVSDFGGNSSMLAADPTNASNMVLKSEKTSAAQTWAGTTLGTASGLATAIPFATGATSISAIVYAPATGLAIRMKVEDHNDPTKSVETEVLTSVANAWDTLVFDFSNQVTGTAAINFATTYDQASIFYDFGTAGATPAKIFYLDDVFFSGGGTVNPPAKAQIDMPITWNDTATVDYTVSDFGGNSSMLAADPTNASNMVLKSEKTSAAQTWAGTTLGTASGLATAIPFATGATSISAIVYAPATGLAIRMKVEDHNDPTKSVETEVLTSVANAWDTLVFDFSNQVSGTAAINFATTYDKASMFYDFGTAGATPAKIFYLDDVFFGGSGGTGGTPGTYNVTFQVDMNQFTGSFTTPELNGDFNGWCGSCTPLSDSNNDGIWDITIPITADSTEYKFSYDNWTGEETLLAGTACTKTTGQFTNRFITLTKDTVLPVVCWESCTSCGTSPASVDVTFQVDLSVYSGTFTEVNLNGSFNNWCGSCAVMTDTNNDSIYEITVTVPTDTIQFKYTLDGWNIEEQLTAGSSCTKTVGAFTNRVLVPSADTTLGVVCWESCSACTIGLEENDWISDLSISPNPTNGIIHLEGLLTNRIEMEIQVVDIHGKKISSSFINSASINSTIDLSGQAQGMYLVRFISDKGIISKKVILNN